MNALEKYAAKKKFTDKLLTNLIGEKPGILNLLRSMGVYGGIGHAGGNLAGMGLDKGVNVLLSKGGKTGPIRDLLKGLTNAENGVLSSLGEGIGQSLGSIHGAKKWVKGRQAYNNKKLMAAAGASGIGGAGLGALLSSVGKKKQAAPKFSPAMDKSPALIRGQSGLPDKVQAAIIKKRLEGKKKKAGVLSDMWAGAKRMVGGNPYDAKTQPAQHAMAKGGNQSGIVAVPKVKRPTSSAGTARTDKAMRSLNIAIR